MSPNARFCAECGSRVEDRMPMARLHWEQLRARAAAVDWERVGRVALPVAALLLAGLLGYGLGRQDEKSSSTGNRTVSRTGAWRAQTASSKHSTSDEETSSQAAKSPDAADLEERSAGSEGEAGAPARFRDFQISASSWELAHPPVNAADGDPYTFWHAWKSERFPEGEWLTLSFPTERVVSRIGLLPGRLGAGARAEGRVRSVMVKAGKSAPQKLLFEDRPEMQYRDLKTPLRTRKLVLRVVTVLPGRETRHLLIPEVQVWGYPAPTELARRADG
jgi:hypothetical protein